ncbi:hypothetical protein N182_18525 [Sinorhizobium sp. GL2]|nr:hypothetical protein N182_18525 [Sinorhizobium sp. GL2]
MRKSLAERRAEYVERLATIDADISDYESGVFQMKGKRLGGDWVDETPRLLAQCKHMKAQYESFIADIDERIEAGEE